MSEVKSVQFPSTASTPAGTTTRKQVPISLVLGMEKDFQFSNQEEGERITAAYISCTYSYHAIIEELKQISETEDHERQEEVKRKEEETLEQIKQFQQNNIIKDFSRAVREEEQKASEKKQREILKKTLK